MPHKLTTPPTVRDLLRTSPRRVRELLRVLEEQACDPADGERRGSPRVAFPDPAPLVVRLRDDYGRRDLYYAMIPRNISSGGVALLHGQFVYPGTPCVVHIPACDGRILTLEGSTVHCRMVEGRIHELGVEFATPADLAEILRDGQPG